MNQLENQTIALAGLFQAAHLVDQIALSGNSDSTAFNCSFESLFKFDTDTTIEIYEDFASLESGFTALVDYLGGENKKTGKNIAYYVLTMLKLSAVLLANDSLAEKIQRSLVDIKVSAREFDLKRDGVVARIDGLYQDKISKLEPRIMVRGDQYHLQNSSNAAKVRTLLLAGIRAAVLWHQLGGSKWKLVMSRRKYVNQAQQFQKQA
jgi:high frequency lysogenization protein